MLYPKKPKNYITEIEVAACIIEYKGEILLLQKYPGDKFGDTWVEPGGKVDPGENNETAMIREIFEESGIIIQKGEAKMLFKKFFHFDDTNIAITFYHITLLERPTITLSKSEHSDYKWVTPEGALNMDFIDDFDIILKEIYSL